MNREDLVSDNNDMPRTRTIEPIETPPASPDPTLAQLKADIDSGATGDKTPVFDPGLSPLGTDDEAAGRPPGPYRIALARYMENMQRWAKGARRAGHADHPGDSALYAFLGMIVCIGVVLAVGIGAVR